MKNTVVIITDLGIFKAFKLDYTLQQTPRLELLREMEMVDAHGKILDKVTDQAGRYRMPTGKMAMSYADRQKLSLELRRRIVKQLAEQVSSLLKNGDTEACYLAAHKEIYHQLLDELDNNVRGKITKVVAQDLTKVEKSELLEHFVQAEPAGR